ncbi:MAG: helix-turn-helix domain-containing protein [Arenicellales bacterium]|nr:helix-turn-helix domain-containing protein [Arenicellales bacterium]
MKKERLRQGNSIPVTLVVAPMFSYLSLAICIDAFRVANRLTTALTFDWTIAGESGEEVASSSGPGVVPHTTLAAIAIAPVVILLTAYDPESACTPALMTWLRRQDRRGSTIGCVDTGALVLARAGVLQGRQVAAHQEVVAPFREEIGELLLLDRRHIFEGNLASSAGGFATMDMVLKLIECLHSDELARRVAHAMNFDMPSSDRVSENPDYPSGATRVDRRLGRMIAVMQANLEAPLPIAEISALALVEESTARRLFKRHFKQSPRAYYMHLRLERARNLLRYSHLSVAEIAAATGFADSPSFSHSFSRAFGVPPSQARSNDMGIEYRLSAGTGPPK